MTPSDSLVAAAPGHWDRLGMGLSGLCAVHCVLTPFVLATLPLWPAAETLHTWLHPVLAVLIVPVTALAMRTCLRRHGAHHVFLLLSAGLLLVLAALLGHDLLGPHGETAAILLGSGLLVTGHWQNRCQCPAHLEPPATGPCSRC